MNSKESLKNRCLIIGLAFLISTGGSAKADFTFGTPINLGSSVNTSYRDGVACTSTDGLSLFFASTRPGGYGAWDLLVATRATTKDSWEEPVNLGQIVNSSSADLGPDISDDSLTLILQSNRPGGQGGWDLWITTRMTIDDPWDPPINLETPINSSGDEVGASASSDALSLFFSSTRPGGYGGDDLYVATRHSLSESWEAPLNLGSDINTTHTDRAPSISADGRMLFFHSDRPGGQGSYDLWLTRRSNVTDSWEAPVNIGSTINSSVPDVGPSISDDGRTLFFMSSRSGGFGDFDAWQVSIDPVVDLNVDGIVDAADMCIMVDHWGTDNSLCDIGPMPWGDGVVDVHDLIALAEHLFEEI